MMTDRQAATTLAWTIAISGGLIIGFFDGFWDALGVFLLVWANNITTSIKDGEF